MPVIVLDDPEAAVPRHRRLPPPRAPLDGAAPSVPAPIGARGERQPRERAERSAATEVVGASIAGASVKFELRSDSVDRYILGGSAGYFRWLGVRPGDVALDLGGHIGFFAIPAAKLCQRVVLYEPDPENLELLRRNIERNSVTNIQVREDAVVGKVALGATFPLYMNDGRGTAMHSLLPKAGRRTISVTAVPLTAVLALVRPDVVKCDIEGAELEAFLGTPPGMWSSVRRLIVEYHISQIKDWDHSRLAVFAAYLREAFPDVRCREGPSKSWNAMVRCSRG